MEMNWKKRGVLVFLGLVLLSMSGAWATDKAAEGGAAPSFTLSVKDNTLSVEIEDAPLGEVLKELARQAQLKVYLGESRAAEKISAKFDNLPLEEGVKRLLKGKNYTFTYDRPATANGRPGAPRLAEIRVVSTDSAPLEISGEAAVPPAEKSLEDLARKALQAPEPADRMDALKSLYERGKGEEYRSTVASALRDKDQEVRDVALELVLQGVPVSTETLKEMALGDASPELRIRAWNVLVEESDTNTAAMEYARQALQDPDPQVRAYAQRTLQELAEE